MTMMTPIEGITAPLRPGHPAPAARHAAILPARHAAAHGDDDDGLPYSTDTLDPDDLEEDFARAVAAEGPALTPSRRADGWTPDRQRGFLDYLAQGCNVSDAATLVGMSAASAYAFRKRAAGAAFAVGWHAAQLLQRNRLADNLMDRAFRGITDSVTNHRGETIERHRHDNRLALALLTRLDRIAAADLPDRTGDARAARLAAQDWDRYLDLIGADASPAQAGLFLSLRSTEGDAGAIAPIVALARADLYRRTGAGHVGELAAHDLDPAQRHAWTAADWARAEACGLLTLAAPAPAPARDDAHTSQLSQHSTEEPPAVWWCDHARDWRTAFPPPADFDGWEDGRFGDPDYTRSLSDDEADTVEIWQARQDEAIRAPAEAERARFFADLLAEDGAMPCSGEGRSGDDRQPDASAVVGACEGEDNAPTPVRAELAGRPSKYHFDGTLAEAPFFAPRAMVPEVGSPVAKLKGSRKRDASAVHSTGPDAGVNPASSDGAQAPPAGPALGADAAGAAPSPA